jgi:hypothetical protein
VERLNVVFASLVLVFIYGFVTKICLRRDAVFFTLPLAVVGSIALIKFAGPVAFFVGKAVIFLLVKIKLIIAKYFSVIIGGILVNIIPGIGQIVSILVVIFLTILLFGTIVEFYQWILSLFSRALLFVRGVSNNIVEYFGTMGFVSVGLIVSTIFDAAIIGYPTYVGFSQTVIWVSEPFDGFASNTVLFLCGVIAAAFSIASYRRSTGYGVGLPAEYFDPRELIEIYFG